MSVITLPTLFRPSSCALRMAVTQRVSASPFGGSEEAVDLLNDRWLLSCELPPRRSATGSWIDGFVASFRGQTNTILLHHFAHPVPTGTLRGTLTLNAAAAQGASSIVITGGSPSTGTLKQGDLLGVGGLLLMVAIDCTAVAGVITVPITNRLRVAQSSGASVSWDKPTFAARLLDTSGVQYFPGVTEPVSFDFGEAI